MRITLLLFLQIYCIAYLSSSFSLSAQSTNATPYCYPTASNMTTGTCTGTGGVNGSGYRLLSVALRSAFNNLGDLYIPSCYGSKNSDVYRYWNDTFKMYKGFLHTFDIFTPSSIGHDSASVGIWIDLNNDSQFSRNEFIGSNLAISKNNNSRWHKLQYFPNCNINVKNTRMRIRVQNTMSVSDSDACSSPTGFGETWDVNIKFLDPIAPDACIKINSNELYTYMPISFSKCSTNPYQKYKWYDLNSNKTKIDSNNFNVSYTTYGQKCVKLIAENCSGTDTSIKCFLIDTVTALPEIDFKTCNNTLEQYESIRFYDYMKTLYKSKGITKFKWEIYDSTEFLSKGIVKSIANGAIIFNDGNVNTGYLDFYTETPGVYTVKLTATNALGSTTVIKKDYIRFEGYYNNEYLLNYVYLNPNGDKGQFSTVRWYDTATPYLNNLNNVYPIYSKSGSAFNFKFYKIDLADVYDSLILYDDSIENPSKIIAIYTSNNNGTKPLLRSSNGYACVRFTSNSSGNAKGIRMNYYTDGNELIREQNFKIGNSSNPVTKFETKFFNSNQNYFSFDYYKRWFIDGIEQTEFENKDTLRYFFTDTGKHVIRLEAKGCDSLQIVENTVYIKIGEGITGYLFKDLNSNCIRDNNEPAFKGIPVRLYDRANNLLSVSYTLKDGRYSFRTDTGFFRIYIDSTLANASSITSCHGSDTVIQITDQVPYAIVDLDLECKKDLDLTIQTIVAPSSIRLNNASEVEVIAGNRNIDINKLICNNDTVGGKLIVNLSSNLTYDGAVSGALTPSVNNKTLTYTVTDFTQLNKYGSFAFNVKCSGTDTVAIINAQIISYRKDLDSSNNRKTTYIRVVRAYDPNNKVVYPELVKENYTDWLTYTINFQNTGEAPAANVILIDTLDNRLDIETFEPLASDHDYTVRVDNYVLKIEYENIELPDSFTSSEGSKGYFQFKIKTKNALLVNETLDNLVDIYFDDNDPVRTNSAKTTCWRDNYIFIPDTQLVIYLNNKYSSCMKGHYMDTTCIGIRTSVTENISGLGVKDLYGMQFFYQLKYFNCNNNTIDSLTWLSKGLNILHCSQNAIKVLPYFPVLDSLDCGKNKVSTLPQLSQNLLYLKCDSNQIAEIDALPQQLNTLNCSNNSLDELPDLPSSLKVLNCENNKILCFNTFDVSMSELKIGGNLNKCLPNHISVMDTFIKKIPICINGDTINNPNACEGIDRVGVNDIQANSINIYPNPVSNILKISSTLELEYVLMDINGQILIEGKTSTITTELNMSEFSNGIYLLKVGNVFYRIVR